MPLLYEEVNKAFIRLQEEIMKESDDQSLFAWDCSGLLALSPAFFKASGNIISLRNLRKSSPFSVTNKGIRLHIVLESDGNPASQRATLAKAERNLVVLFDGGYTVHNVSHGLTPRFQLSTTWLAKTVIRTYATSMETPRMNPMGSESAL
ncbi:hypothetical protein BDV29DRAFT_160748 [Aspergillus leporis]|uniref:DUF8212 domain-containing protein n=1 Tax=Aspergillus leporis TaxID=41062 RepID=A0A5N5WQP6_9EURO|nr:hypothetical protein BDV29DRAFT_160748 [Aspergillus leporis]